MARGNTISAVGQDVAPFSGSWLLYYLDPDNVGLASCHHGAVLNSSIATANGGGDIPSRSGTIPLSSGTGSGELCFFNGGVATAPVNITIT